MSTDLKQTKIGHYQNLDIELVTWDCTTAEVELSCACIFEHEMNNRSFSGGLAHLDEALNGRLNEIRENNWFSAQLNDALLINQTPSTIQASKVLLIGMGRPEDFTVEKIGTAIKTAVKTAHQLELKSVAFAPSILDTGLNPPSNLNELMLRSLKEELDRHHQLHLQNLVKKSEIERWIFDSGFQNYEIKAEQYIASFAKIFLQD
ncbi:MULTISPECIES: M17 family peptidase N-terminal domain-containing protein [Acinetobacter]|uniref:M17 family peptidase N-terminal domain-containing protein n=1 Tax=Acinetobacter geminorum TaxID=2730922 RepID=A0ABT8ZD73_9GAMM|nr:MULTISPECIES: M17 family peptidase N-terminal domain-containing protein [Acinetobacter]MCU4360017.1 peptidase M17 [Acinetobacter sp. WU_MDCI_Abxc22]MDO7362668.1 M17 family peptidase N-terminal domain-containing protein [Acinetobacter geminorum]OTL17049.1 peptidase M17 [Acinetobacter pittii]